MMKGKNNGGFSLVEILVAMAILASVVIPVCSSMLVSVRINAKAEAVLNARLAVSSAVETLRAEGYSEELEQLLENETLEISAAPDGTAPYYNIKVAVKDEAGSGDYLVEVDTVVSAKKAGGTE